MKLAQTRLAEVGFGVVWTGISGDGRTLLVSGSRFELVVTTGCTLSSSVPGTAHCKHQLQF